MVCIPLKRCAKYVIVMEARITLECHRGQNIYEYLATSVVFLPIKRLYLDHFEELLGHFDCGYLYTEHYHQQKV